MNMSRLTHVCMSINLLECRSRTFAHWAALGRFDERLHKQGKCILHSHIAGRLQTLQRGAVLSINRFYQSMNTFAYSCCISVCEPASCEYAHYFWLLWAATGGGSIFFQKHDQDSCPPPPNFRGVPASLHELEICFWTPLSWSLRTTVFALKALILSQKHSPEFSNTFLSFSDA